MLKLLLSFWYGVPLEMKNIWYNQSLYSERIQYPEIFDKDGRYIPCRFGTKVIMNRLKSGHKVYYTITAVRRQSGGDWLNSSDAYTCDLTLSHISKA